MIKTKEKYWRKKYDELDDKYWKLKGTSWDRKEKWFYSIICMIFTILFTILIISLSGGFDSPVEELGINEDRLVRGYVLDYYPEFENCSIEYDACADDLPFSCVRGAKIYCNELDNRDDFKVEREKAPTEVLYFDDIDLEDILLYKIRKCQ